MSWKNIVKVSIPGDIIRDVVIPWYNQTATKKIDLWIRGSVGLDLLVHNRGALSVVVSVNNIIVKDVPAGASFSMNDFKIGLVKVTATTLYDLVILAVSREKLQRLRIL